MAGSWTITGIPTGLTKTLLGRKHKLITVEMPIGTNDDEGLVTEGVVMYVPTQALNDGKEEMKGDGPEAVWTVPVGTTIFRTALQPVSLGEPLGPSAIPASAPARLVWKFVEPLALPAA
ncbi:MAG: hypothetical protein BMS9Abin07_1667 [Acidimicrobiia bacterium]|nr:MAG: hypothetical protein BMS9Abin07_1667 [Acidimicrobiia bacterium]